ncbi:hypothetical protein [Cupriavidus basilensis]
MHSAIKPGPSVVAPSALLAVQNPFGQVRAALVSVGFAVDESSDPLLLAELHGEAGRVSFVSLPALLACAAHVAGIDRLVVAVESGKVRLVGNDRQAWNGFMGNWQ